MKPPTRMCVRGSVYLMSGCRQTHTWTTQIGRSVCLVGKRHLFAVGGVFSFLGSVFFQIKFCAKQAAGHRRNSAGNRRNSAGNRPNLAEAGFSMSECLLRFSVFFFLAGGVFWAFRRNFCRRGLSAESSAAGGSRY